MLFAFEQIRDIIVSWHSEYSAVENNVKSIILKHFPFPFHENKFKMHEGIKYPSMALQIALLILLMGLEIWHNG